MEKHEYLSVLFDTEKQENLRLFELLVEIISRDGEIVKRQRHIMSVGFANFKRYLGEAIEDGSYELKRSHKSCVSQNPV